MIDTMPDKAPATTLAPPPTFVAIDFENADYGRAVRVRWRSCAWKPG